MNSIMYYVGKIMQKIQVPCIKNSYIDKKAKVCRSVQITDSSMGKYSYLGPFSQVVRTKIGNYCSIANYCYIGQGSHPLDWISTSPVFYGNHNLFGVNFSEEPYDEFKDTRIGNDVWIGSFSLIKGGITIGDGAVIGMGAVVTKDVGPYEIWAGNPAKLIRKRFDEETIERLLDLKWWNWDDTKISSFRTTYDNVKEFLEEGKN